MKSVIDKVTELVRIACNILLISNPVGTAFGVLCGFVGSALLSLAIPWLTRVFPFLDWSAIKTGHMICAGVVVSNISTLRHRNGTHPKISEAIKLIDTMKNSRRISASTAAMHYHALINKAIETAVLKDSEQAALESIERTIRQEDQAEEQEKKVTG
jgi:hypothetical protein